MNKEGGKKVILTDNTTHFSLYLRSQSLGVGSPKPGVRCNSSRPYLKLVIDWKGLPRLCVLCFMGYKVITPVSQAKDLFPTSFSSTLSARLYLLCFYVPRI